MSNPLSWFDRGLTVRIHRDNCTWYLIEVLKLHDTTIGLTHVEHFADVPVALDEFMATWPHLPERWKPEGWRR